MENLKYCLIIGLLAVFLTGVCDAQKINKAAQEAYDLRMDGKADRARLVLENYLKLDSADAMANYEYARTLFHITPQRRDSLNRIIYSKQDSVSLNLAHRAIDRAIQSFPDNYRFYWSKVWIPKAQKMNNSRDSLTDANVLVVMENIGYLEKALALSPENEMLLNSLKGYQFMLESKQYRTEPVRVVTFDTNSQDFIQKIYNEYRKYSQTFGGQMPLEEKVMICEIVWQDHLYEPRMAVFLSKLYLENKEPEKALEILIATMENRPEFYREYLIMAEEFYRYSWQTYRELKSEYMQMAKNLISTYLNTEPCVPHKIFALKQQAIIFELNEEVGQAELIREEAQKLDPYIYSRNSEWEDLYTPLSDVVIQ